jgi:hypothetical protein
LAEKFELTLGISNHFFYSVRFSPGQIKIVWGNTDRQTFAKYYENSEQKIISQKIYIGLVLLAGITETKPKNFFIFLQYTSCNVKHISFAVC